MKNIARSGGPAAIKQFFDCVKDWFNNFLQPPAGEEKNTLVGNSAAEWQTQVRFFRVLALSTGPKQKLLLSCVL